MPLSVTVKARKQRLVDALNQDVIRLCTKLARLSAACIIIYLHQDRLRQLLSVDYLDRYLLTRNTVDPELNQSCEMGMMKND